VKKNKVFSFINILGLSVGLSCCLLIAIYLYHEFSYDTYHKNINELYQLGTTFIKDGKGSKTPNTPAPIAAAMKQEFPEIAETARMMMLFGDDKTLLQYRQDKAELKSFMKQKDTWQILRYLNYSTTNS
jgi:putative ABC transport system permease protein